MSHFFMVHCVDKQIRVIDRPINYPVLFENIYTDLHSN